MILIENLNNDLKNAGMTSQETDYVVKITELLSANEQLNQKLKNTQNQLNESTPQKSYTQDYEYSMMVKKDHDNQTKINRLQKQQQDLLELVKSLTEENKSI